MNGTFWIRRRSCGTSSTAIQRNLPKPAGLDFSQPLTPDNIAQAVSQTRPAAVDVASGVESAPGLKDLDKVLSFITHARSA